MPDNKPLPGWHVRVAQVAEADLNEIIDNFIQLDEIDHAADIMDALGPVGMARFFQDFGLGSGDYTAEREKSLEGITVEDIIAQARTMDNK